MAKKPLLQLFISENHMLLLLQKAFPVPCSSLKSMKCRIFVSMLLFVPLSVLRFMNSRYQGSLAMTQSAPSITMIVYCDSKEQISIFRLF